MKALLLASTLGLTFLANTAVAAVSSEESSVWRNAAASTVTVELDASENDWKRTEFTPVDSVEQEEATSVTRKVRF